MVVSCSCCNQLCQLVIRVKPLPMVMILNHHQPSNHQNNNATSQSKFVCLTREIAVMQSGSLAPNRTPLCDVGVKWMCIIQVHVPNATILSRDSQATPISCCFTVALHYLGRCSLMPHHSKLSKSLCLEWGVLDFLSGRILLQLHCGLFCWLSAIFYIWYGRSINFTWLQS